MCPCQSSAGQIRLTVVSSDSVEVRLYIYIWLHAWPVYIFKKENLSMPMPLVCKADNGLICNV